MSESFKWDDGFLAFVPTQAYTEEMHQKFKLEPSELSLDELKAIRGQYDVALASIGTEGVEDLWRQQLESEAHKCDLLLRDARGKLIAAAL